MENDEYKKYSMFQHKLWPNILYFAIVLTMVSDCVSSSYISPKSEDSGERDFDDDISEFAESEYNMQSVEDEVCNSTACIKTAENVMNWMNESADPCDNFYEFACGKFIKETNLPNDTNEISQFSLNFDLSLKQLHELLKQDAQPYDTKPFMLAKRFYKSCMNTEIIEKRRNKPLIDLLEMFGGWPVLKGDKWSDDTFNWIEIVKKFHMHGLSSSAESIFSFRVIVDKENTTVRVCQIGPAIFEFPVQNVVEGIKNKHIKAYFDLMVNSAVALGADIKQARKELMESLNFEMKLAKVFLFSMKWIFFEQKIATIKQLQTNYPYINWLDFINAVLPKRVQVNENEPVFNSNVYFLEELGKLLQGSSKRSIANYLSWRVVLEQTDNYTNELRQIKLTYAEIKSGQSSERPRWKECTDLANKMIPIATGAIYIREYFNETYKNAATEMVNNIKAVMIDAIEQSDWMDSDTKDVAIHKAKAIVIHIGYPVELKNVSKLKEFFKDLDIEEDNLMLNVLRINRFHTDYEYGRLRVPVNKTDWTTVLETISYGLGKHIKYKNSLEFPANMFQGRFYSIDRPRYINYALIGQLIGTTISSAFGLSGRFHDTDVDGDDWFSHETFKKFSEKQFCFINQYDDFIEPHTGLALQGDHNLVHNAEDSAGLKQAYIAYNNWLIENGPEPKLPGMKYTTAQLFWISAAQLWCSVSQKNYLKHLIEVDNTYSPNQFRAVGPISNQPDFAFDFNCRAGTKMNPAKKCEIW